MIEYSLYIENDQTKQLCSYFELLIDRYNK